MQISDALQKLLDKQKLVELVNYDNEKLLELLLYKQRFETVKTSQIGAYTAKLNHLMEILTD